MDTLSLLASFRFVAPFRRGTGRLVSSGCGAGPSRCIPLLDAGDYPVHGKEQEKTSGADLLPRLHRAFCSPVLGFNNLRLPMKAAVEKVRAEA